MNFRILLLSLFSFLCLSSLSAQSEYWSIQELPEDNWGENQHIPNRYISAEMDLSVLDLLKDPNLKSKRIRFDIPTPENGISSFLIQEYHMMDLELREKYPNIKTFKGKHLSNPNAVVHITVGPEGIDGLVSDEKGMYLFEAIGESNSQQYAFYRLEDYRAEGHAHLAFQCDVDHETEQAYDDLIEDVQELSKKSRGETHDLREYRLAVATTGEFSNKYGGTVASVLQEVVSIMNKVNLATRRDVGVQINIVADSESVFFFNSNTDPYTNGNTGAMLGQNGPTLRTRIAPANYDIGHVFGTNGGGLASLGSVCGNNKENGVSCQFGNYSGNDFFIIVAHEMGHQFTATHTFNFCDGNESPGTAFEPGSGNTIMSYSGAGCAMWNQRINDAYYHINSIQRMLRFTRQSGGSTCGNSVPDVNTVPDLEVEFETETLSIPIKTPFELTGSATDMESDDLSYTWEGYNLGEMVPAGALPRGTAPHFKFNPPTNDPTRVFPKMSNIVNNQFSDRLDYLPDNGQTMNFRFTARDNNDASGAVAWEDFSFDIVDDAGPFRITYPSDFEVLIGGTFNNINWDPAESRNSPVNCEKVDILLSRDGGYTYPDTLVAGTDNDGSAVVEIPADYDGETSVRVKIKCSDNIFFDISDRNSSVTTATEPGFIGIVEPQYQELCLPTESAFISIDTRSIFDYQGTVYVDYSLSYTDGVTIDLESDSLVSGNNLEMNVYMDPETAGDTLDIDVMIFNELDTFEYQTRVFTTSNDFNDLQLVAPVNGQSNIGLLPDFEWTSSVDAELYEFQLATNASFETSFIVYELLTDQTSISGPLTLDGGTIYFWRVNPINYCGNQKIGRVNALVTESLTCSTFDYNGGAVRISANSESEVELNLNILDNGIISDLNVLNIEGGHSFLRDLSGTLVSPRGTRAKLWTNACGNRTTLNASFDDEAANDFDCVLLTNGGAAIPPEEPLSIFNTEQQFGVWKLLIEDNSPSEGGEITDFKLEVCASFGADNPDKITNDTLILTANTSKSIPVDLLEYANSAIDPQDIIFQLTEPTSNGEIRNGTRVLSAGNGFRMSDVLAGNLAYYHQSNRNEKDQFKFIVYTLDGGWAGVDDVFHIRTINGSTFNSEKEIQELSIYPNPNGLGSAIVTIPEIGTGDIAIELSNINGVIQEITSRVSGNALTLNWSETVPAGIYFVKIETDKVNYISRLVIVD